MRRWSLWLVLLAGSTEAQETRFEVSFPAAARAEPVTGRVYVMISRTNETEPRLQISQTGGTPFFGRDVERAPGEAAILDESDLGSPVPSLRQIPAGEYFVQAFVNVYSEFRRSDGHVVWMHDDRWEGQKWNISPGNLHSLARRVRLDPESGYRVSLVADQVIPPIEIPPDSSWVKRFHLFVLDAIESAASFSNEETGRVVKRWHAGEEVVELQQRP
jgi:hypothetical protein